MSREVHVDRLALVILFEIEETQPRLLFAVRDRHDYARLMDWLEGQPELAELVRDALELASLVEEREQGR